MAGVSSVADLKATVDQTGKTASLARPTTAGIASTFGQSEALTAASVNVGGSTVESQLLSKARGISASRFSRFEENEKSAVAQPYKAFFTSNEPTTYHKENRFECLG